MKNLILIFSLISFKSFACNDNNFSISNDVQIWLGKNSAFSKTLNKSKCILDQELQGLSLDSKRLIAKLILKSYQSESKLDNYNF